MTRFLPVLLVGLLLGSGSAHSQERTERLTLDGGVASARGKIKGNDSVQYSFTVKPNQQLSIKLLTSNPSNYFNLEREGTAEAVCQGALTGNVCAVRPDAEANYVVDVFLMRNAARRGEAAEFTLSVEQGAAQPEQASPASKAAASKEAALAAVAACKSALALKSGVNAVFVLPVSHVPAAGGQDVFLSLKGASWLCTTDSRGNVNRLDPR